MAEWQRVKRVDDSQVGNVEGRESFVGAQIVGVGNESRRISGGRLIYGVAVVECL